MRQPQSFTNGAAQKSNLVFALSSGKKLRQLLGKMPSTATRPLQTVVGSAA